MAPVWPPHIISRGRSNTYASASTGMTWFPPDNLSTVWALKACSTHIAAMKITATVLTWKYLVRVIHQKSELLQFNSSTSRSLLHLHRFPFALVPTNEGDWSGNSWGPVALVAVIAGPVFLLCVLLMVGVFLFHYHQRAYNHRQRLEVEDPSCDHLYMPKDKTLQDLIYDMSTSGSGSGQYIQPQSAIWK